MRRFWILLGVQLRGMLTATGGRRNRRKGRVWPTAGVLGLTTLLVTAFSALYSFGLAATLQRSGSVDLVLVLMPLVGVLVSVVLGGVGAGAFVFGNADNDLLLSLPIPRTTLAAAKLGALAAENLLVLLCVSVPAGAAYAAHVPTPWFFWPVLVTSGLLLGCLATTLSALVGLALTLLKARRRGKLVTNILAMALMLVFLTGWMAGQNVLRDRLLHDPGSMPAEIARWLPPFEWTRAAAVDGSPGALAALAAVALMPLAALAWVVGRWFVTVVSAVNVRGGARRDVRLGALRARTPFAALVRREAQRFFGTTVLFVNSGFGLVVVLLGAAYLLFAREVPMLGEIAGVMHSSPAQLLAAALALVVTTFQTTSSSISLEGRRFWILKEAPVPAATILDAKASFPLLLAAPVVVPAALAVAVTQRPSAVESVLLLATPLASVALGAALGLVCNLAWPNLQAPSETVAVKQGASVAVTLFGAMIGAALAVAAGLAVAQVAGPATGMAATVGVLLAGAGAAFAVVRTWGVRAFAQLD